MENRRRKGVEEGLAKDAEIIASTSSSSNDESPAATYVGEVDERISSITENAQTSDLTNDAGNEGSCLKVEGSKDEEEWVNVDVVQKEANGEAEDEAAAATLKVQKEAEAKKKADEEASAKAKAEADADAKKKADEEAAAKAEAEAKKAAEAEAKKKAEAAAKVEAEAAAKKKAEEEAKAKAAIEAEIRKKARAEEQAAAKAKAVAEAEAKKKAEAEAEAKAAAEAKAEEEAAAKAKTKATAEAEAKKKAEEDTAVKAKVKAEEEAAKAEAKAKEEAAAKAEAEANAADDLDLDALLDDSTNGDSVEKADVYDNTDVNHDGEKDENFDQKFEINIDILQSKSSDLALFYDGEDDDVEIDFEVIEEPANIATSKIKKKFATYTNTDVGNMTSNVSNSGRRILFQSTDEVHNKKTKKKIQKKDFMNTRKQMPTKKAIEERLNEKLTISTSISETLSHSKKKIMTTRDRMRDYSRGLSSRALNQIRKENKYTTPGKDKNSHFKSPFLSTTTKRSFMSPTLASSRKFWGEAHGERNENKSKSLREENVNKRGFRHYMRSTVTFTNKVIQTENIEKHKTKLKESGAKKVQVILTPWKNEMKKCANNYFGPRDYVSPRDKDKGMTTPNSRDYFSPRDRETGKTTPNPSASFKSPARSYAEQSVASLTSHCTVQSFVSPTKEALVGCQQKFDPFLHKTRGACELCVFRLSETERGKLDANGRHLFVQFTTGGCPDCTAFPKSIGELQVRLCNKCHTASHRRVQTRRRKKGNGTVIGYSFATVSKGN